MHNILVVGASGTIGAALLTHLQSSSTATIWGTTYKRDKTLAPNTFYLNLLDSPSEWHFPEVNFDVVYLCAGVCRMALCEEDPVTTHQANVIGMAALAQHWGKKGAFVVYLSTNQVFSGNQPWMLPQAAYEPLNEYGSQKAKAEQLIVAQCPQWAIVRLTKVMEPNMPLIKTWIDRLKQHQPVEAFTDMMLAPVTLKQVINVLTQVGNKKQTGYFQVSGAKDVSYHTLAHYLAEQLGCLTSLVQPVSAIEKGMKKSFLPPFTTLDCSSTIALCGEKPPCFNDVVQECFDSL